MSHQSLRQALLPDAGGVEEKLRTQFVSGNAFNALGVSAAIGRVLLPSDDVTPGAHQVAVISHAFWKRRLGGNPGALGQWIQLEQKPYQIVGVAQAGFTGAQPGALTDIWLPNMMFQSDSLAHPELELAPDLGTARPGATRTTVKPIVADRGRTSRASCPPRARGASSRRRGTGHRRWFRCVDRHLAGAP